VVDLVPVQKVSRKQKPALQLNNHYTSTHRMSSRTERLLLNRTGQGKSTGHYCCSPSEARGEKCRAYISPNGATSKMRSIAAAFHALLCEEKPKPLRSRAQRILLHTQTREPWAQTGTPALACVRRAGTHRHLVTSEYPEPSDEDGPWC
jgi:hypothetical protein